MASPPACTPPTKVPIFDPSDFTSVAGQFVNYPVAQGNLTLLGVACSGLTCSGSATAASLAVAGAASANSLTVSGDNTVAGVVRANGGLVMGADQFISMGTNTLVPTGATQIGYVYPTPTYTATSFSSGANTPLSSGIALPIGVYAITLNYTFQCTTAGTLTSIFTTIINTGSTIILEDLRTAKAMATSEVWGSGLAGVISLSAATTITPRCGLTFSAGPVFGGSSTRYQFTATRIA